MADSRITRIYKKIAELVASDYTSGYSGLNLSSSVLRGSVDEPPYIPFGTVQFLESIEDFGPTMGRFQSTALFEVYCFVGGSDIADRSANTLNLISDMIEALTENRQLGIPDYCDDIKCSFLAIDGDKYGIEGVGIGYIRAEVNWQSSSGA